MKNETTAARSERIKLETQKKIAAEKKAHAKKPVIKKTAAQKTAAKNAKKTAAKKALAVFHSVFGKRRGDVNPNSKNALGLVDSKESTQKQKYRQSGNMPIPEIVEKRTAPLESLLIEDNDGKRLKYCVRILYLLNAWRTDAGIICHSLENRLNVQPGIPQTSTGKPLNYLLHSGMIEMTGKRPNAHGKMTRCFRVTEKFTALHNVNATIADIAPLGDCIQSAGDIYTKLHKPTVIADCRSAIVASVTAFLK